MSWERLVAGVRAALELEWRLGHWQTAFRPGVTGLKGAWRAWGPQPTPSP